MGIKKQVNKEVNKIIQTVAITTEIIVHSQGWQADAGCWQEVSVTTWSSPLDCLMALMTWQLAFPRVGDQQRSKTEAAMSFMS